MKTPKQYDQWLKRIKKDKEADYSTMDDAAFEMESNNYNLLYHLYKKMNDNIEDNLLPNISAYNQLMRLHNKFLEAYGFGGYDKLKNKYMKRKIKSFEKEKTPDDALDTFLCD